MQHSGQMGQNIQTEKTIKIQLVRLSEVCGKVLGEKNAYKSVKTALLLVGTMSVKTAMLLVGTTKTAVCLQTKVIFQHLYRF